MATSSKPEPKSENEAAVESMQPVGLRDYQAAKDHLSRNSGFDFDSFLEEVRSGTVFEQPLGPGPECLSVDQISDYVENGGVLGTDEKRAIEVHLEQCNVCSQNVETYRELAERHVVTEDILEDALSR